MAFIPNSGSVVAFQSDPTKLVGTFSVVGNMNSSVQVLGTVSTNNSSVITVNQGSIAAVIIGGSIAASFTPPANQSVSGIVGASVIGNVNTTVTSIATVGGFVNVNLVGGSILTSSTPNQSVSGTIGANLISSNASVITVGQSSIAVAIVSGSIAATFTPPANQSVSGVVGASIIGIPTVQTGNTSVITVIQGSVAVSVTPAANQSVSGIVGASIVGYPNFNAGGSVVAFINNTPAVSVQGTVFISGSVVTVGGVGTANQSVSGTVGASILGNVNTTITSVATVGGFLNVNLVGGSILTSSTPNQSISGTVGANLISSSASIITVNQGSIATVIIGGSIAASFTPPANQSVSGTVNIGVIPGSVVTFQGTSPWVIQSIIGTYSEDVGSSNNDKGLLTLGIRNDTVASLVNADLDYTGWSTDSAGRHLIKPFAADEVRIDFRGSVVSTSVTLIAASVIGKRNYVTDFFVANTGATTTLVDFKDGSTSILGTTIAPSGGGSNAPGLAFPLRTAPSQDLVFQGLTATSILYITIKGYQAP